jgi:hypothetical protein
MLKRLATIHVDEKLANGKWYSGDTFLLVTSARLKFGKE